MRIYTKFGDKGNTSLLGGTAVPKSDPRLEAYGSVDELNATLGIVLAFSDNGALSESLKRVQGDLFVIGAELASKGSKAKQIAPKRVSEIEAEIDKMEAELPPLHHFIAPGGSKTASLLHLARTVCRRVERAIVALSQKDKVNPDIVVYMNRVGDLLFVLGRYENYKKKVPETIWKGR
ncbi:cob(I)yrinic acid a,c-diamide adenosyltransferase [Candidatus Micrarchaeota archaeon]|nr:cob(I)yrinic acid a,c-diamide adenosyltransferase [Candidatus Micrarchaeota archaeon]